MDDKKNSIAPEDDMVKPVSSTNSSESVEAKDESSPLVKGKYPKIVFLIIINEFCERFSFYGFRTVLFIFLTNFIGFDKTTATSLYHGFAMVCYFTPLFGAILADGYIGLYKTIVYLSLFYAAGEIVLTLTSMGPLGAPSAIGPLIGLLMIGIGTGGIKPCVAAFGGNQFKTSQKEYLANFFSLFYLSINIGSTIGTLLTPIFRNDVKCFGNDCYPLAFGVPALLMLIAVGVFVAGTPFYRRDNDKPKGGNNIIIQTASVTYDALKNKFRPSDRIIMNGIVRYPPNTHWLDYASPKFNKKLVSDVKILYKVLFVFLPLPVFWALYDQQGSNWTSQASRLSGRLGDWTIKPDQFQAVNPILIVAFVPVFDYLVYPLFAKCGLLKKLLQRMWIGMLFTVAAFLVSALLEYNMQSAAASQNIADRIRLVNLSPCRFEISNNDKNSIIAYMKIMPSEYKKNVVNNFPEEWSNPEFDRSFRVKGSCQVGTVNFNIDHNIEIDAKNLPKSVLVSLDVANKKLVFSELPYELRDSVIGFSEIKFVAANNVDVSLISEIILYNSIIKYNKFQLHQVAPGLLARAGGGGSNDPSPGYTKVDYAKYSFKIETNSTPNVLLQGEELLEIVNKYTVLLFNREDGKMDYVFITDVHSSGLHIAYQLIQILVITAGEIMFSISGLSFAYSEAPQSMKSVISAAWLLTVAFGNLIVVIIAELRFFENQIYEYLLFSGLLLLAILAFIIICYFYEYTDPNYEENQLKLEEEERAKALESKSQKPELLKSDLYVIYKKDEDIIDL